jgi:deoxyribose-phosphate aldolase
VSQYDIERLTTLITREVISVISRQPEQHFCTVCGRTCDGHCISHHPDVARNMIALGADRLSARLGVDYVPTDIAEYIDHTLLKPEATEQQIRQLCAEAVEFGFASVCVNPTWASLAAQLLAGASPMVATVIGFPLGATLADVKAYETQRALEVGADEFDMVINIGALKSRDFRLVEQDIAGVVAAAQGRTVKVIIETALLTDEEKVEACVIAKAAGADFVKTSTGFASKGATAEDVALMRRVVGSDMGVKASGGIRSAQDAQAMIEAGATRIGASAGVKIVKEIGG